MKKNVEVILSTEKRRHYSAEEKARIVRESLDPGASVSTVARANGIAPNLLYKWRAEVRDTGSPTSNAVALAEGAFCQVKVSEARVEHQSILIHIDGRILIELPVSVGAHAVGNLVRELGR